MVRTAALLITGLLALPASAQGQAPASPPCSGPEYRALDFWVGEWTAKDAKGQPIGTNRVTRDEYGNCVITEHFRLNDGSLVGHSVSIYVPRLGQWRQTWVDNQGGYFDLVGGPVSASDHMFTFETKRVAENMPFQRMIFADVKADSFTWRWQSRKSEDQPWSDSWVIAYSRKPGPKVSD